MLRSVAIEGGTPAAAFLRELHNDLVRFGRDDVLLIDIGGALVFVWNPDFTSSASATLREEALAARLVDARDALRAAEALLDPDHFNAFDIDFAQLKIEVIPCKRPSAEERLFEYVAKGQSAAAETKKMRLGKFLVFDSTPKPARIMGTIALKSPKYFDGARDQHLGWPSLSSMIGGERVTNPDAITLRNAALKSILNIAVCMAVPPYDRHGVGKLIAALALSDPVIGHMEAAYPDPVLGLTTTGIWGGSAGQYERIRLGRDLTGKLRGKLFQRTHTITRSLNYVPSLFSKNTYDAAFRMIDKSHEKLKPYYGYDTDPVIQQNLLYAAVRHVRVPRRAIAANVISHYFGCVSKACRDALATVETLKHPPVERSLSVDEIYAEWLARTTVPAATGVSSQRLSELVA